MSSDIASARRAVDNRMVGFPKQRKNHRDEIVHRELGSASNVHDLTAR